MIQVTGNMIVAVVGLFVFQSFVSYVIGYVYGSKAERRQAILHGLAEWIPYKDGTPVFVWRDNLPGRLDDALDEIKFVNKRLECVEADYDSLHDRFCELQEKYDKECDLK